jgi:hypothetical protein
MLASKLETLPLDVHFIPTRPVPVAARHAHAACLVRDTGAALPLTPPGGNGTNPARTGLPLVIWENNGGRSDFEGAVCRICRRETG